jgi:hypothetical protein
MRTLIDGPFNRIQYENSKTAPINSPEKGMPMFHGLKTSHTIEDVFVHMFTCS